MLTAPVQTAFSIWGARGEEHQEGETAPVPWASSAASLSPGMRKKSVSVVCAVQNPKCLAILRGCLLGGVLVVFCVKDRIISCDRSCGFLKRIGGCGVNN